MSGEDDRFWKVGVFGGREEVLLEKRGVVITVHKKKKKIKRKEKRTKCGSRRDL